MKAEISSVKENPLLGRREVEVTIDHEGEATSSEEDIVSRIAAENNLEEENIEVDGIYTGFGSQTSKATLKVFEEFEYDEELEKEAIEEDEEDPTATTDSDVDYEEIVSGTITDAKDQLNELENPDYQQALEAEEANKDRKTFKEWLEAQ